jgi:hypothetical protein
MHTNQQTQKVLLLESLLSIATALVIIFRFDEYGFLFLSKHTWLGLSLILLGTPDGVEIGRCIEVYSRRAYNTPPTDYPNLSCQKLASAHSARFRVVFNSRIGIMQNMEGSASALLPSHIALYMHYLVFSAWFTSLVSMYFHFLTCTISEASC